MQILVGDIGGTRTRLRLLERDANDWHIRHETIRRSRDFDSLDAALDGFLTELSPPERMKLHSAWLAVAGPVAGGRARFTNLPWECDEHHLATRLGLQDVHLVNDLEALSQAIPALGPQHLVSLQQATAAASGRQLIVSVGTGLGLASWSAEDGNSAIMASEGGHSDFAPMDDEQASLARALAKSFSHVSYERVLSGDGLLRTYRFFAQRTGATVTRGMTPRGIVQLADQHDDPTAEAAVRLFARSLGAFVGNAALYTMASGGVYIAGGVIAGLHPWLRHPDFFRAFQEKGRLRSLLADIPVHAVTVNEPGLEGITQLATTSHQQP